MKEILGQALFEFLRFARYRAFGNPLPPVDENSHPLKIEQAKRRKLGSVDGKYYLYYIDVIKLHKRLGQYDEAVELLLKILDAVEREAAAFSESPPPWYYEQLGIIYRKQKRFADEIAVLDRYESLMHCGGKFSQRLIKAKILAAKAV